MKDIFDDIEKWLHLPDNDCPEKRAKLIIKVNRLIYNFVRSQCSEHCEIERMGIANILEAIEDYRTDLFITRLKQQCKYEEKEN